MKTGSHRVYRFLIGIFILYPTISTAVINLIPQPSQLDIGAGYFILTENSKIAVTPETELIGLYLAGIVNKHTGMKPSVVPLSNRDDQNLIILTIDSLTESGAEGYHLNIDEKLLLLSAANPAGVFYGCQTLRQLLPRTPHETEQVKQSGTWQIPTLKISDSPRFAWRGMMLDVSRHFFPKEFIKELIDYLAYHKLNTFHWHLMDDQGWRVEIKQYPKLTEIGAWRVEREGQLWHQRSLQEPGETATYGGYYTQEEIREIVAYAKERFITIVPEIEMPAHITCALAAYPELSCTGGPFTVPPGSIWPLKDIYCAGRETTFQFLENVLTEIIDLFPGTYIHVGGDEANKGEWEKCDSCQTRIATEGLQDEAELQSYFIRRIERFLKSKDRKLIGWDEILEGGLAPDAAVMSWRGTKGGIAAARAGHEVVMSPVSHCYLNCYQGELYLEPLGQSRYLPLSKVYSFDPVPDQLTAEQARFIIGAQANLWAEFVPTPEHAEYMLFPRLSALSEVLWSPESTRDWEAFRHRIIDFMPFYEFYGINYSTSSNQVRLLTKLHKFRKGLTVNMYAETPDLKLHYSLDGSIPTAAALLYSQPIRIKQSADLRAVAFKEGEKTSPVSRLTFTLHKANAKRIALMNNFHWRYKAGGKRGLVDGIRGTENYRDGRWQGYRVVDLDGTIKLGWPKTISSISTSYLQDTGAGIFMPLEVEYAVSNGGKSFRVLGTLDTGIPPTEPGPIIGNATLEFDPLRVRYIRVRAKNIGTYTDSNAGKDTYIFVDEIVVN